ncbi:MAG: hypothetical protein ACXWP0_01120 [Ktedonobacterales bacterium]
MTIREALRKEFQEALEDRLEKSDIARRDDNEQEQKRHAGFVLAYHQGLQTVDALQDSDQLFAAVSDVLFDAFRLRHRETEELARAYEAERMPTDAARTWGQSSGYALIAASIRAKADKYAALHAGLA